jgi:hypothetical protein
MHAHPLRLTPRPELIAAGHPLGVGVELGPRRSGPLHLLPLVLPLPRLLLQGEGEQWWEDSHGAAHQRGCRGSAPTGGGWRPRLGVWGAAGRRQGGGAGGSLPPGLYVSPSGDPATPLMRRIAKF